MILEEVNIDLSKHIKPKIMIITPNYLISSLNGTYDYRKFKKYKYNVKITKSAYDIIKRYTEVAEHIGRADVLKNRIVFYSRSDEYMFSITFNNDYLISVNKLSPYVRDRGILKVRYIYYDIEKRFSKILRDIKIKKDNKLYYIASNKIDLFLIYVLLKHMDNSNKNLYLNFAKLLYMDIIKIKFEYYLRKIRINGDIKYYIDVDEIVNKIYLKHLPIFIHLSSTTNNLMIFLYTSSILMMNITSGIKAILRKIKKHEVELWW